MLLAIFAIVITLVLVIGIHEYAHALTAGWFGIKIKRISIGFGRPLILWTSARGVEWTWSMWPLGGYVELLNSRIHPVHKEALSSCFDTKPFGVKVLVLASGVIANILVAWLAFILAFFIGLNQKIPVIKEVLPGSVAYMAGLHSGEQILSIQGKPIHSWTDVGMSLFIYWGEPSLKLTVLGFQSLEPRNANLKFDSQQISVERKGILQSMGIVPDLQSPSKTYQAVNFMQALTLGSEDLFYWFMYYVILLKLLITGALPFSLMLGPLGFLAATIESFKQGFSFFTYFIGSFSIAVALVNILPIPGLDGGSIVYAMVEKFRGKPVSIALEVLIHRLIFIALCILLVHLLMNDLGALV